MNGGGLEERIKATGKLLFDATEGDTPSLFDTSTMAGRILGWTMDYPRFRTALFRFIDVFPVLNSGRGIARHVREYFGDGEAVPKFVSLGARIAGAMGAPGGALLGVAASFIMRRMGNQFIIGGTAEKAVARAAGLRRGGYGVVFDALGEATLSEDEAERYVETNLRLLSALSAARWNDPAGDDPARPAWPRGISISVKPSALYCLASPMDFEGSVNAVTARLGRIYGRVIGTGGFLCVDMETRNLKDITLEAYRRLRLAHPSHPRLGVVLQAYLKETEGDLEELIRWARARNLEITVRLVKGAYWDYERVIARLNGWETPVRERKADTDAAYERLARKILLNHDICRLACATHNIRTIAAVMETAQELGVPGTRYGFQMLYGMAEPVRRAVLAATGALELYSPFGDIVPGMGYLVRRLLENTSNESFLRASFTSGKSADIESLLEDPAAVPVREKESAGDADAPSAFVNEPAADFTSAELRSAFPAALRAIRGKTPVLCRLYIGGKRISTADRVPSLNPADPSEALGTVCMAGKREAGAAVEAAKKAFPRWRDTPPRERAAYLRKAASIARGRIVELAAWQVLEIGKQWDQAYADVTEAVDYFEYYAGEMERIAAPARLGNLPGERNLYFYEPRGVAAVIAPWNFPLAISAGMASAAVVAGNTVVYKPSGLTGIIGKRPWDLSPEWKEAFLSLCENTLSEK